MCLAELLGKLYFFALLRVRTLRLKPGCPELRVLGPDGEMVCLSRATCKNLLRWCAENEVSQVKLLSGSRSDDYYLKAYLPTRARLYALADFEAP